MQIDDDAQKIAANQAALRDYDLFQLTALICGLDPERDGDCEWVLSVVSEEEELPDDVLPETSAAADQGGARRAYETLFALLRAGRLTNGRFQNWKRQSSRGAVTKELVGEYSGVEGERLLERDERMYRAYEAEVRINGERGAPVRVAKRFGMTAVNCRLRLKKYQRYLAGSEQRQMLDRKQSELRKSKKDT